MPAFYALSRDVDESVDVYWNRFQNLVEDIRKDPSAPKLDPSHLRRHFLTTLGGDDFMFLKHDWENSSLDPKWTRYSDAELKSELRVIQQIKSSSRPATISSQGFAYAVKSSGTPSKSTGISALEDKVTALALLMEDTVKIVSQHAVALSQTPPMLDRKPKVLADIFNKILETVPVSVQGFIDIPTKRIECRHENICIVNSTRRIKILQQCVPQRQSFRIEFR